MKVCGALRTVDFFAAAHFCGREEFLQKLRQFFVGNSVRIATRNFCERFFGQVKTEKNLNSRVTAKN
jgi:hypothetical protein